MYHLHVDIDHPPSMVLTEKDFIDFVINNNRKNSYDIFPDFLQTGLSTSSFLFIGYSVHDISLLPIFQGPLCFMSNFSNNRNNLAVIEVPSLDYETSKQQKVLRYLEQYFKKMLKTKVYWEFSNQFIKELLNR